MLVFLGIVLFLFLISFIMSLFEKGDKKRQVRLEQEKKLKEDEILIKNLETQLSLLKEQLQSVTDDKNRLSIDYEHTQKVYQELLQQNHIMDILHDIEEINFTEKTKHQLAKLWDIIPYYPPDWELRKYIVQKRDHYKCKICGLDLTDLELAGKGQVHHIIPLLQGGTNEIKNLIYLCIPCHRKLHNQKYNYTYSKISERKDFTWKEYNNSDSWNTLLVTNKSYQPTEPDTDFYYNISKYE